ncbi:hypothetical protein GCM10010518_37080 [Kitasatospora cinereorecta]
MNITPELANKFPHRCPLSCPDHRVELPPRLWEDARPHMRKDLPSIGKGLADLPVRANGRIVEGP